VRTVADRSAEPGDGGQCGTESAGRLVARGTAGQLYCYRRFGTELTTVPVRPWKRTGARCGSVHPLGELLLGDAGPGVCTL